MRKLISFALAGAVLLPVGVAAQATVTANVGYMSQYYYRGILQKTSSASAGLTVASGGLSAGTWAADVGSGSEVDLFASYALPLGESATLTLGGTGYFYTDDFDNTYLEGNFGAAFGVFSIAGALGTYDVPGDPKYFFLSATAAQNGFFGTVGTVAYNTGFGDALSDAFDKDLGGQYATAGYNFSAGDMDFSVAGLMNDAMLSDEVDGEITLIFTVGKVFTISGS
ncbi:MAG: TorF family putative porin [Longimicrobiales bacterium]